MSASSTCTSATVSNLALTVARCTGFTKVHGENEFTYVLDLEWTDERRLSVKRTFTEIQKFNNDLVNLFPELRNSKLNLKTSIRESVVSLFTKDKRGIAEKRELLLDQYLCHLLRQPERIRHSNLVLSFFDSRDTDPKPCKYNSPSEKADSGIDLTDDKPSENPNDFLPNSDVDKINYSTDSKSIDDDNQDISSTDNEYEGETSETETDDETYDEDYFLDVGIGELMLQTSIDEGHQSDILVSPSTDLTESSMWCSNVDKFSNFLRSSMTNLNTITDNHLKPYKALKPMTSVANGEDNSDIIDELVEECSDTRENSETESQLTGDDRQISEHCESSDEELYYTKPLSKTNMKHYYLSSNNLIVPE